jgi:N-hydroxyarylamine O-acetyltransferase
MSAPYPAVPSSLFAAYLRRLGLSAAPAANLSSLSDLMARHLRIVPFENLDVVAGTPRALSTASALDKVVTHGRGGFCYELNEAFRALLDHLSYDVRRIEARVWQPAAQQFGAPFDHLALVVCLSDGEFLVDVGYGDGIRAPLVLPDAAATESQAMDISGHYRLTRMGAGMLLLSSRTQPLYEMTLSDQPLQAFESMCRFHQTSAESVFSKGLICTRATESGRVTVSGARLIVTEDGRRTEAVIADLSAVLRERFGIEASVMPTHR